MKTYDKLKLTKNITWTGAGENFSEAIKRQIILSVLYNPFSVVTPLPSAILIAWAKILVFAQGEIQHPSPLGPGRNLVGFCPPPPYVIS